MAPSITPREAPIRPIADELAARRRRLLGIGIGVVWLVACALLILSVVLRARSEPEKGSSVLRPAVRASSRIEAAPASPGVGNSPASGHADDRVD